MDAYDHAVLAYRQGDRDQARSWLQQAHPDGRAWLLLGQMASEGDGEPENPAKAAGLYAEAAARGSATGAYNLAALYATGRGVPLDYPAALAWYQRAAELGDIEALRKIGVLYHEGRGVPADVEVARQWYRRAADAGDAGAMELLGQSLSEEPDPVPAADWLLRSVAAGNRAAAPLLRPLHDRLMVVAEAGRTRAQALLGLIDLGFVDDLPSALRWFGLAAEGGDPQAQCNLAVLTLQGKAGPADPARAALLFRAAAQGGELTAAFNLGLLYLKGQGVPTDHAEAVRWLRVAGQAGNRAAYPILGNLLSDADQDEEALSWFVKGAENGDVACMKVAGDWYRDGYGGGIDLVQSLRWYLAMLAAGNGDGLHESHGITPRMTDGQIQEAARLAGRPDYAETFLRIRGVV
jgi:TPR repeat protein